MKPDAFFELAEWLADEKKTPASLRSAISRAYYGAFHTAIRFLDAMGIALLRTDSKHERVPDLLYHSGDVDLLLAGRTLVDLRSDRNLADYQLDDPDPEQESTARGHLQKARRVIGILNTCLAGKGNAGSRFEQAKAAVKLRADFLRRGPISWRQQKRPRVLLHPFTPAGSVLIDYYTSRVEGVSS